MAADVRAALLDHHLERYTDATITDRRVLENKLNDIRSRGYSVSRSEINAEAGSVAAPILSSDGYAIGAVSICGPVNRISEAVLSKLSALVREAGDKATKRISIA
jgi:DNA-binding IclR family transcriptional regulator